MERQVIKVAAMPSVNPTYSQVVAGQGLLFLAGQLGLDYTSGQLAGNGIRGQARQALENVRALLEAAGSSLAGVLNVTVYITNWGDLAAFNEVYGEYFAVDGPAKTAVGVTELALGGLVEIQVTALAPR